MKKAFLFFSFLLLLTIGTNANNEPGLIMLLSGKIIDKQTGETLAGVKVQIKGTDVYCLTDMSGAFILTVNAPANADVVVDMAGYEPATLKTQELSLGSDIVLIPR